MTGDSMLAVFLSGLLLMAVLLVPLVIAERQKVREYVRDWNQAIRDSRE